MTKDKSRGLKEALARFDEISNRARADIYALVFAHYENNPNSPWSGRKLVTLEKSIKAFYKSLGVEYNECFADTLPAEMKIFYDQAKAEAKKYGYKKSIIGEVDTDLINYHLNSSYDYIASKTTNMCANHIRQLRSISADVMREMSLTGGTRKAISKAMLAKAMEIPGFKFIDKANRQWSNKSYFDMLARTEIMNASREAYDNKITEEGYDVMLLIGGGNPCPKCAKYERRLFSLTGATKGLPTKQDLIDDGVFHPNCTHSYSAVPDSLRDKYYDEEVQPKEETYDDYLNASTSEVYEQQKKYDRLINSKLSSIEIKSIQEQTSLNRVTNLYIRGDSLENLSAENLQKLAKNVKNISNALDKIKIQDNIILYRRVKEYESLFNENKGSVGNITKFINKCIEEKRIGHFEGFTATSLMLPDEDFGKYLIKIKTPKGTSGCFIKSLSYFPNENEFLLNNGIQFIPISYSKEVINGKSLKTLTVQLLKE